MPRYFFNMSGGARAKDQIGTDLPSLDAARTEAIVTLGYSIKDNPNFVWSDRPLVVEVTDVTGAVVATVTVSVSTAPP